MSNAFEALGTAKRDIKAGETITVQIAGDGFMSADISLNRHMPIRTATGETTLGELLKKAASE